MVDRSRFTVDGGLLANTPTRYALSAIARMPPADGPTRRVMLLVHPHAPLEAPETPARPDAPPTVVDTLAGLLTALTGQGSRNFAEEIDAHNRNAAAWRDGRSDVLAALANRESLHTLVQQLWPHYQRLRVRQVRNEWVAHSPTPLLWSAQRIRSAVSTAFDTWSHGHDGALPFLPAARPGAEPDTGPGWPWGLGTAIAVVDEVGDLTRRALGVAPEATTVDAAARGPGRRRRGPGRVRPDPGPLLAGPLGRRASRSRRPPSGSPSSPTTRTPWPGVGPKAPRCATWSTPSSPPCANALPTWIASSPWMSGVDSRPGSPAGTSCSAGTRTWRSCWCACSSWRWPRRWSPTPTGCAPPSRSTWCS